MEWCTRDRKTVGVGAEKGRIVQEDSDYCSGTEQAFSRNEPLSAKNSPPLQKDMGGLHLCAGTHPHTLVCMSGNEIIGMWTIPTMNTKWLPHCLPSLLTNIIYRF